MKKLNVYQISPNQIDITSLYRGVGPYGKLAQTHKDLDIRFSQQLDLANLFWCDVFVIQRPFNVDHYGWITTAKDLGKPVIADFDDDITNVPSHNPHQAHYTSPQAQQAIKACIGLADHITVSTETLKQEFSKYNSNITVVSNALDPKLAPKVNINWDKRKQLIMWRGGESHTNDLIQFKDQLINLTNNNKKWMFEFFGGADQFMNYMFKPMLNQNNTHFTKTQSMLQYLKTIGGLTPLVTIVPLYNDVFNVSKSNIAWIEATVVGSVVVAPDMADWQKPGVITYSSKQDFEDKTQYILNHPEEIKKNWQLSNNYIQNNLTLDKMNEMRYNILLNAKK